MQNSLGLYIHIPFCKMKCHYCDFPSYSGMECYWDAYTDAVILELENKAKEFNNHSIKTIFIGGGTPSLLPSKNIKRVMDTVNCYFHVLDECEATIEANPGTLSQEKLETYNSVGLNRLSLGLQACQENLLKRLGRIHTFQDFEIAVELAQKVGFHNINADIIFGIPDQTVGDLEDTFARISSFNLTHISCYSLKIEEGTVFWRMKENGDISEIDDKIDRQMYHYAVDVLEKAGFMQYEISNFSKPHYLCKHNMNYWECGEYLGVGSGAHSFTGNRRYANIKDVVKYIEGVNKGHDVKIENFNITSDERLAEKIILGLRLNKGVDFNKVSSEFSIDVEKKYFNEIAKLVKYNLVECSGTVYKLTKKGMDLANTVFVEFI